MKHFIENYLWLLPFFSFLGGYFSLSYYMKIPTLTVPSLVGKDIHEAVILLSQNKLSPRIFAQKEDSALPEGTILRQVPAAGQKVKSLQPIFLVTAKKQPTITAPSVINKPINTITKELTASGIRFKAYYFSNNYPLNHCFSQLPATGEPLDNNYLLLYLSAENNKPIIWPDFTQRSAEEVIEFLAPYHIQPHIIRTTVQKENFSASKVIEQQPLAGSLILLQETKPLFVQLRVE